MIFNTMSQMVAVIVLMWNLWNCLPDQSEQGGAEGEMVD